MWICYTIATFKTMKRTLSIAINRSELAAATIGMSQYDYEYDTIGNRLWSAANAVTNSYTANSLNQYTSVSAGANPVYDADGNMTDDGVFTYAYDAENRLVSVTSASLTNGAIRVQNAYDHRNRRIRKIVQHLHSTDAPPPAPPTGTNEWLTLETHTFVWDGNNIVLEEVEFADGTTRTFEYFWGLDKSGTEQGAGGVGGLLAVSMDGVFYIPCYDHNGNIILYVSETGSVAAQYTYDPYGSIIESSGPLANMFSFGFSTQYHDRETGMVGYQQRFLIPAFGRWLNRDPIEEEGGENLYACCRNNPVLYYDIQGTVLPILIPLGPVLAEAAAEAAAAAAAAALAAVAGTLAGEAIRRGCQRCRPCDPPVGTKMYRVDVGHSHARFDPHVHYYTVHQSPPSAGCRCFAPPSGFDGGDRPSADAIPYRYPTGGGTF